MDRIIGYMLAWTTYGSWLQGDKRKYSNDGEILPADKELEEVNKRQQKSGTIRLTSEQQKTVKNVILQEAQRVGQEILAISVSYNHVHVVVGWAEESIENTLSRYKNVATFALGKTGLTGKMWTRGFNKKFCFRREELAQKISYVCHRR